MPGDDFEVHLLARRADQDRRMRLSNRLRLAPCFFDRVVLAVDGRLLLGPETLDDLQCLIESANAFCCGVKRDAIGRMLLLEPARADSQNEPASGCMIQRYSHFGEQ